MPITVSNLLNIDNLKNMKLITGQDGLNVIIKRVGILDYEFINKTEGQFGEGDFVISSFLFAKDDISLLIGAIKSLIKDGVACLAIKNVYYKDLPYEIVTYANERSFPIFLFNNSIFIEDLITDITDLIRLDGSYQLMEAKIDKILNKDINMNAIRETALEINKYFRENFIVIYFREKKFGKDENIIGMLKRYNNEIKSNFDSVFKYKNGILAIITQKKIEKNSIDSTIYSLISDLGINTNDFYAGISKCHDNLNKLDYGVKECLYAMNAGEILSQSLTYYKDIGLYKVIMPFIDEYWIKDFYESLILPLKSHDGKYSTEFLKTAVSYIDNNGNIKDTAEALFQHENTIRYRINKIKIILNIESNDFYEQLSIAVKIYKILHKEFRN